MNTTATQQIYGLRAIALKAESAEELQAKITSWRAQNKYCVVNTIPSQDAACFSVDLVYLVPTGIAQVVGRII